MVIVLSKRLLNAMYVAQVPATIPTILYYYNRPRDVV